MLSPALEPEHQNNSSHCSCTGSVIKAVNPAAKMNAMRSLVLLTLLGLCASGAYGESRLVPTDLDNLLEGLATVHMHSQQQSVK